MKIGNTEVHAWRFFLVFGGIGAFIIFMVWNLVDLGMSIPQIDEDLSNNLREDLTCEEINKFIKIAENNPMAQKTFEALKQKALEKNCN